jgi:hypothetical protein
MTLQNIIFLVYNTNIINLKKYIYRIGEGENSKTKKKHEIKTLHVRTSNLIDLLSNWRRGPHLASGLKFD